MPIVDLVWIVCSKRETAIKMGTGLNGPKFLYWQLSECFGVIED